MTYKSKYSVLDCQSACVNVRTLTSFLKLAACCHIGLSGDGFDIGSNSLTLKALPVGEGGAAAGLALALVEAFAFVGVDPNIGFKRSSTSLAMSTIVHTVQGSATHLVPYLQDNSIRTRTCILLS